MINHLEESAATSGMPHARRSKPGISGLETFTMLSLKSVAGKLSEAAMRWLGGVHEQAAAADLVVGLLPWADRLRDIMPFQIH
jgi:hypothetical protein